MEIKLNLPKDKVHIQNIAYIRALLIKCTIDRLHLSYNEKERIRKEILEYLRNT